MSMRKVNIILSLLILGLCFIFWRDAANINPPAHIYPKTIIITAGLLACILLIQAIFFSKNRANENPFKGTNYGRVLTTLVSAIIFFVSINIIGFYVSSFFFIIIVTWILGDKGGGIKAFAKLGLLSIVVTSLVYVSFKIFLKVPTPTGFFM